MAIVNLFSKRQKKLRGDIPDVYTYDSLPYSLRVQIVHIWNDSLGYSDNNYYRRLVEILCREYGLFHLCDHTEFSSHKREHWTAYDDLKRYLLYETKSVEKQIDIVELSFQILARCKHHTIAAIEELNNRFKEHGIGFQFVEDKIIRIDSEFLHVEAVKPALRLLNGKNYKDAQDEFLNAHEQYRHGKNKEAMNACLRSFESIMKSICNKHKWHYEKQATAKSLIDVCRRNNLIPSFWENTFKGLQSALKGVAEGRNKLSGHADEPKELPPPIPNYLVEYMLHMTASNIVFLISAEKELEK